MVKQLGEWLLYCTAGYINIILQLTGYYSIQVAGDIIWPIPYLLLKRRKKIAMENMLLSKVAKDEKEAKELTIKMFKHLVKVIFEIIYSKNRRKSTMRYVKAVNFHKVSEAYTAKKGGILIFGHYGNWELGASLALYGSKIYSVVRPVNSPTLNNLIVTMRRNKNHIGLVKFGVVKAAQEVITRGDLLTVDMDQNAGAEGTIVKFFGLDASSWRTPAILSLRYKVPVIPVKIFRRNCIHYITICDPIYPDKAAGKADKIKYLTQLYVSAIEKNLREMPYQWLWILRRWKLKKEVRSET